MADEPNEATRKLEQVRGVTWEWREDAPDNAKEQPGIGVIAQEVEQVFPELVVTDEQGRKKVNYVGLIGPLIEAVKELDQRLAALEQRIAHLEQRR
jgi:trimeric autotransporter adhesin